MSGSQELKPNAQHNNQHCSDNFDYTLYGHICNLRTISLIWINNTELFTELRLVIVTSLGCINQGLGLGMEQLLVKEGQGVLPKKILKTKFLTLHFE